MRVIAWYSSGINSAAMVKLALNKYPELLIVNCETNSEHLDNKRFDSECESSWNKKITD